MKEGQSIDNSKTIIAPPGTTVHCSLENQSIRCLNFELQNVYCVTYIMCLIPSFASWVRFLVLEKFSLDNDFSRSRRSRFSKILRREILGFLVLGFLDFENFRSRSVLDFFDSRSITSPEVPLTHFSLCSKVTT